MKAEDLKKEKASRAFFEAMGLTLQSVRHGIKDPVLLLGATGSGKSTTICALLGVTLERRLRKKSEEEEENVSDDEAQFSDDEEEEEEQKQEEQKKSYVIDVAPSNTVLDFPKIGHRKAISETLYAKAYPLALNRYICDCPGFFDTRGTIERLIIALGNNIVIKESQSNIRAICLATPYSAFDSSRGSVFMEGVIKTLGNMFTDYNPADNFARKKKKKELTPAMMEKDPLASVYLLFTKVPENLTTRHIYDRLRSIRNELKKDNSDGRHAVKIAYLNRLIFYANFKVVRPLEREKCIDPLLSALYSQKGAGIPTKRFAFIGNKQDMEEFEKFLKENIAPLYPLLESVSEKYPKAIAEEAATLANLLEELKAEVEKKKEAVVTFEKNLENFRAQKAGKAADRIKSDIAKKKEEEKRAVAQMNSEKALEKKRVEEECAEKKRVSAWKEGQKKEIIETKRRKEVEKLEGKKRAIDEESLNIYAENNRVSMAQNRLSSVIEAVGKAQQLVNEEKRKKENIEGEIDAIQKKIEDLDLHGSMDKRLTYWSTGELDKTGSVSYTWRYPLSSYRFYGNNGAEIMEKEQRNQTLWARYTNETRRSRTVYKAGTGSSIFTLGLYKNRAVTEYYYEKNDGNIELYITCKRMYDSDYARQWESLRKEEKTKNLTLRSAQSQLDGANDALISKKREKVRIVSELKSAESALARKKEREKENKKARCAALDDSIRGIFLEEGKKIASLRIEINYEKKEAIRLREEKLAIIQREKEEEKAKIAARMLDEIAQIERDGEKERAAIKKGERDEGGEIGDYIADLKRNHATFLSTLKKHQSKKLALIEARWEALSALALAEEQMSKALANPAWAQKIATLEKIQQYIPLPLEGIKPFFDAFKGWKSSLSGAKERKKEKMARAESAYRAAIALCKDSNAG